GLYQRLGDRRDPHPWRRVRRDQGDPSVLAGEGPARVDVPHDDPRPPPILLAVRAEPPPPRARPAVLPPRVPAEDQGRRRPAPRGPRGNPRPLPGRENRGRHPHGGGPRAVPPRQPGPGEPAEGGPERPPA